MASGIRKRGKTGWMSKPSLGQHPQGSRESNRPRVPLNQLSLSSRAVLLGLPRSCLTISGSAEVSECAGGMNRLLHVLLPWPGPVDPLSCPQAQGQVPERGPPQSAFLPHLGTECAACGNSRRECLQTGLGNSWGGLPAGEDRFRSEAPQIRGRTQHGPCPWPAWPRHSWPPVVLPHERVGYGGGAVSRHAFPLPHDQPR